ncbi:glycoside hydrolase domain-containing protein [Nocardia sp. NRRL S-836]|uniref:glycoside hydrolase domain-containing protein n=1 Tax=Nocardia sp. NRRL S-836 TaxID=1519492 RepID=UPI0006ADCD37|nr:glycoside hydrolase domain-containing protein [Nocardia sp. NRRL S-836]
MVDQRVVDAQRFINSYNVDGIPKVEENGRTSWDVMYGLTRVLQHELRLGSYSDTFGPGTLGALQQNFPNINGSNTHGAINKIIAHGLYCKGYSAGEPNGVFNSEMSASVTNLKRDMGVDGAYPGDGVTPKVFKGLLTMDPYVRIDGGRENVRAVQRWLNGTYVNRRNFFIIPCDGYFSRDVQKALLLAIQFEIGMSDDVANGVFGPGTKQGIRNNLLAAGSSGRWVSLFSAAMILNQRDGVVFDSVFTAELAAQVLTFQRFCVLPETGKGDFQTWASLLVSTGDDSRRGTALDCVTQITTARAQALRQQGYLYVGRYLSNVPNTTLNKKIQDGELSVITGNGLRVFPIYQTYGGEAAYFNRAQGRGDAFAAIDRAKFYGFKRGTRIYFAVDYDAYDYQVTDNIIPHFEGIKSVMDQFGVGFQIGIYGPRNVCSRVRAAGLTSASFVCDMSTGFSGNLGYPLPPDWAFDQISTIPVGSGDGFIEIDNNIASGRDVGQSSFDPPNIPQGRQDVDFDMAQRGALLGDVQSYLQSIGVPESGGSGEDAGRIFTTTQALDRVLVFDRFCTRLAQTYRARKALVQAIMMWELAKTNLLDPVAEDAVQAGLKDDCSTGIGQIFGSTGTYARNFAIDRNLLNGAKLNPDSRDDRMTVWRQLKDDNEFNITIILMVCMYEASNLGIALPHLNTTEAEVQRILTKYNGAESYGQAVIGLYRAFEKYHAPLRNA